VLSPEIVEFILLLLSLPDVQADTLMHVTHTGGGRSKDWFVGDPATEAILVLAFDAEVCLEDPLQVGATGESHLQNFT